MLGSSTAGLHPPHTGVVHRSSSSLHSPEWWGQVVLQDPGGPGQANWVGSRAASWETQGGCGRGRKGGCNTGSNNSSRRGHQDPHKTACYRTCIARAALRAMQLHQA
jgi:hypothetical protein